MEPISQLCDFFPPDQGSEELRTKVLVCHSGSSHPRQESQMTLLTHGLGDLQGLETGILVCELVLLKEKQKTLFFSLMNYSSFALRPQLCFIFSRLFP